MVMPLTTNMYERHRCELAVGVKSILAHDLNHSAETQVQ